MSAFARFTALNLTQIKTRNTIHAVQYASHKNKTKKAGVHEIPEIHAETSIVAIRKEVRAPPEVFADTPTAYPYKKSLFLKGYMLANVT